MRNGATCRGAPLRPGRGGTISHRMDGNALVRYDATKLRRDELRVERGFWGKIRRYAGQVPFLEDALAAYCCAVDSATPIRVKAVLLGALAYFVLPADVIPDFVAGLGFTDDAAVLIAAVRAVSGHIGPQHRSQARGMLERIGAG